MGAPYTGRCNCGAITARIDAEPVWVRQCWCRQCQRAASGSATVNALFPTEAIHITGELKWSGYDAASGNRIEQGFCPSCGTQVMGRNSSRPAACVLRLGFIDMPNDLAPTAAIWLEEAPKWAVIDPALEQWPQQPPPPPSS
ncbi:MAG: GFA family protein [Novosphingobium sp.]|nr:GFA family protein [Novosphingobium sp.]